MYLEALRRYPVKSMLGEELTESEVTERGLAGDRARAVLDVATGKIASAKNPRLCDWSVEDALGINVGESARNAVNAATRCNVDAKHNDALVASHFLP